MFTEESWANAPHRHSGYEYSVPQHVIVKWTDASETPTEAIIRLNDEAIEYSVLASQYKQERDKLSIQLAEMRNLIQRLSNLI